jgi:hypothetical protein
MTGVLSDIQKDKGGFVWEKLFKHRELKLSGEKDRLVDRVKYHLKATGDKWEDAKACFSNYIHRCCNGQSKQTKILGPNQY